MSPVVVAIDRCVIKAKFAEQTPAGAAYGSYATLQQPAEMQQLTQTTVRRTVDQLSRPANEKAEQMPFYVHKVRTTVTSNQLIDSENAFTKEMRDLADKLQSKVAAYTAQQHLATETFAVITADLTPAEIKVLIKNDDNTYSPDKLRDLMPLSRLQMILSGLNVHRDQQTDMLSSGTTPYLSLLIGEEEQAEETEAEAEAEAAEEDEETVNTETQDPSLSDGRSLECNSSSSSSSSKHRPSSTISTRMIRCRSTCSRCRQCNTSTRSNLHTKCRRRNSRPTSRDSTDTDTDGSSSSSSNSSNRRGSSSSAHRRRSTSSSSPTMTTSKRLATNLHIT